MYRHCIYCSADLGANEALEGFPVGRTLAFDGEKGRLWAVCRKCARWNLAPIEERWEAIEGAEKLFRDTRMRVHSENVGIAKLREGTLLVRIGDALPGELGAWRYGRELERRRLRAQAAAGVERVGNALLGSVVGRVILPLFGPLTLVPLALADVAQGAARRRKLAELLHVVHVVPPRESPTGESLTLRSGDLEGAYLAGGSAPGGLALHVPVIAGDGLGAVELRGEDARTALSRALVRINGRGASREELHAVFQMFARHGSLESFLARQVEAGATFGERGSMFYWQWRAARQGIPPAQFLRWQKVTSAPGHTAQLGIEIVLQEERERRALEGELKLLESAWREAEELAAIADRLAGETPAAAGGHRLVPRRDPA